MICQIIFFRIKIDKDLYETTVVRNQIGVCMIETIYIRLYLYSIVFIFDCIYIRLHLYSIVFIFDCIYIRLYLYSIVFIFDCSYILPIKKPADM